MKKTCKLCLEDYSTKDSRQKCCSRECANKCKKTESSLTYIQTPLSTVTQSNMSNCLAYYSPQTTTVPTLPAPEELPATYVKQVADLWLQLTGTNDTTRKRIA